MMKILCALAICLYMKSCITVAAQHAVTSTCCPSARGQINIGGMRLWTRQPDFTSRSPTFVAFSVGKTTTQSGTGRVTYDRIFLNIGDGFSRTENSFTAPVPGVYQITFGGINNKPDGEELFLHLLKNGEYLASVYEDKTYYGHAQNKVLLELLQGDSVYVEIVQSDSGLYGRPDRVYSTFSGHLIVPIYRVTTYIAGVL